ncbi:hypothetical protein [Sphingomonas arenae]|uniref:hypothetical protein n=1 Tax=Sphingomonas arenae TaxID=2812555 RepID=UPI001968A25A|nr:hypothetical protein [Sphingomonas arenae]
MSDASPPLPGDTLFERRNAVLDLLLGMISIAERTVSTVADLADAEPPPPRHPGRSPPPDGPVLR